MIGDDDDVLKMLMHIFGGNEIGLRRASTRAWVLVLAAAPPAHK